MIHFLSHLHHGTFISFISITIFLTIIFLLLKKRADFFILIFFFLYAYTSVILSCFLMEFRVYDHELETIGYYNGSVILMSVATLIFLLTSCSIYGWLNSKIPLLKCEINTIRNSLFYRIFIGLCFAYIIFSIAILLKYNSPIFMHMNRFDFIDYINNPYIIYIHDSSRSLSFLLGLCYINVAINNKNSSKRLCIILWFTIIILLIFYGQKLSGIFMSTYLFLLPILIWRSHQEKSFLKKNQKYFYTYGLLFFSIITALVIFHYSFLSNKSLISALFGIVQRLSEQGQIWWSAINSLSWEKHCLNKELFSFGIKDTMYCVAPAFIAISYLARNITFSTAYPAILVFQYGYFLAMLFHCIFALIIGFLSFGLWKTILKRQIITSYLYLRELLFLFHICITGDLYLLKTYKGALFVFILLALIVLQIRERNSGMLQGKLLPQ